MLLLKTKKVKVQESFLGFITEHGKTCYDIKKLILDRPDKAKFDFKNLER